VVTPLVSASIAAASIVAKVTRDSLMREYAQRHPGYGFERHKGYPTVGHLDALGRLGPLPLASVHFLDFAVSEILYEKIAGI
jgi:ribonuclease HII